MLESRSEMKKKTKAQRAAQARRVGTLGGSRNTPAQQAARAKNAKRAGRPRRVCDKCDQPVLVFGGRDHHGGHKNERLDESCNGRAWRWQTRTEQREGA